MRAQEKGQIEFADFAESFRSRAKSAALRCNLLNGIGRNRFRALSIIVIFLFSVTTLMAESPGKIDVTGTWKGTRATSGQPGTANYKVQSIKFGLSQNGNTITGSYRCYAGKKANTDCPSPTGKISSGTIDNEDVKLDVQTLPNQVTCSFKGKANESNMSGTYSCYAGGSLSTIGSWKVSRE